jgi:hypothetical protein
MTSGRGLLAFALLAAASSARAAGAAPATARLESTRAPDAADCPDAAALAALVNEGLARTALVTAGTTAPAPRGQVAVTFQREATGYAATVRIGGARGGTRKVSNEGPGCGALASAVGVLLTVVLDANDDAPAESPASSGPPGHASPATRFATTADVGVGGGAAQGLVGGWAPAVGVGGTLAHGHWAARTGVVWLPARSNPYGPGRVDVGLTVARLALCASPRQDRSRFTLELCVQQQLGWMRGTGVDYEAGTRAANHLWLAMGASLVASAPLGRALGWEAEVGLVRSFQEERFVVQNLGTAFRSDPLAFMTTLGFTTRVW